MLRRCLDKLLERIPKTQAAYQQGRSTTELVFSFKVLAEKAITSENYKIFLLLLDMSKAFDTVRRNDLFTILEDILEVDELHMMKILVEDVILRVKIGKTTGEAIKTNIGIPQGDCLSPILFILYLSEALKPTRTVAKPPNFDSTKILMIDQKYSDDVSWITNHDDTVLQLRKEVPSILKEKNLQTNVGKTEQHEVKRNGSNSWKKCKYLGSLLDTEHDISRRKILATTAYNQLKQIFESKKVQIPTKVRLLKSHIESIFLYNSELWTLTKKLENTINVFQRNLLRKVLNIKWPNKISNKQLYERMKIDEWSKTIRERRLSWYGHLLRLPDNTPAKTALREAQRYVKKPRGGQKLTWIKMIEKDLETARVMVAKEDGTIFVPTDEYLAHNKPLWQSVVSRAMLN